MSPLGPSSITLIDELDMGRNWSAKLEEKYEVSRDERLEKIGYGVARFCDRPQMNFRFRVLENPKEVNAFSLPGGYVYVTRAFLNIPSLDGDEIAFALGHEIAHAAFRDIASAIHDEAVARQVISLFCRRLLDVVGPDTLWITIQALKADVDGRLQSRELNADQVGLLYALRDGHRTGGAITLLEKLQQIPGDQSSFGSQPGALPLHPPISLRLAELRKGINQIAYAAQKFEVGYHALEEQDFKKAAKNFEDVVTVFPQSQNAVANLGAALHGLYRTAMQADEPVPVILYGQNLEARWFNLLGFRELGPDRSFLLQAEEKYRAVLSVDPGNMIARNNLAVALLDDRQIDEGIAQLEIATSPGDVNPVLFKNLGIAYCEKLRALRKDTIAAGETRLAQRTAAAKAEPALQMFLKARPDDAGAKAALAEVQVALHQP